MMGIEPGTQAGRTRACGWRHSHNRRLAETDALRHSRYMWALAVAMGMLLAGVVRRDERCGEGGERISSWERHRTRRGGGGATACVAPSAWSPISVSGGR